MALKFYSDIIVPKIQANDIQATNIGNTTTPVTSINASSIQAGDIQATNIGNTTPVTSINASSIQATNIQATNIGTDTNPVTSIEATGIDATSVETKIVVTESVLNPQKWGYQNNKYESLNALLNDIDGRLNGLGGRLNDLGFSEGSVAVSSAIGVTATRTNKIYKIGNIAVLNLDITGGRNEFNVGDVLATVPEAYASKYEHTQYILAVAQDGVGGRVGYDVSTLRLKISPNSAQIIVDNIVHAEEKTAGSAGTNALLVINGGGYRLA